jgi:asparagine synthase (glutamine-hydrolysing)
MDQAIRHRGPDEHAQKRVGSALMGHRRLQVIDLEGGQQPMSSPDGKVHIVYNGEIYNYRELREELRALGHVFNSKSDTEVLLAAYLQWREACVDRLNGMFAFVVYDQRDGSLFAARDRFGEKPLFVCETEDAIYFTSELKALVAGGVFVPTLDRSALLNYFVCSYISGSHTIFENVRRLLAGHCLRIVDGEWRETCYWRPPTPTQEITDEDEAVRQILDLLRDSVRLRMVSDVRLGFFLSGGVDSSALVALAAEQTDQPLETFGIGFEEDRFDERPYQKYVAERFNTRHHDMILRPGSIEDLEEIVWHLDEPFADKAALPTWFLSQMTRKHVTVALSGDGGDEMFAGYKTYAGHHLSEQLRRIPGFVRSAMEHALRNWEFTDKVVKARFGYARAIRDAALPGKQRLMAKKQIVLRRDQLAEISPLLHAESERMGAEALFGVFCDDSLQPLDALTMWDQTVSLPDDMMVKVDRMSMAHSLEMRTPFLDHRLAELANRIAYDIKLPDGHKTKNVLKKAMQGYFPNDFLWRSKQGFWVPLNQWFKDDLYAFARDRLLGPRAIGPHIINPDVIARALSEHETHKHDWGTLIWTLLIFEMWCQRYDAGAEFLEEQRIAV